MEITTDKELIQKYVETGSNEAARLLVEKHREYVFRVAMRYCNNDADAADDLAQESFIRAFASLHTFKFNSNFKTWIYRIIKNTYLNAINKQNIENTMTKNNIDDYIENVNEDENPATILEYKELLQKFEDALQTLPERQREVFCLRYYDEMKYEEISEILGLEVGGLKASYYHAIKKLKMLIMD
ncbi:MAG: sigma-70 family RNA polymerase sigma factor [Bacteroidetes bacterium]|nr:sigma-70 family RNA polymerase sigma factor [Bacteroidota bacterium]